MPESPRTDALVANVSAAVEALYDAVLEDEQFLLTPEQLSELAKANQQIAAVVYIELGSEDEEGEREAKDPSSLTRDEEALRLEGEARDEMNELPAP